MWKLHDRPKASLLHVKVRMVKFKVVEALLNGCATWTTLRATTTSSVLHITRCCFKFWESDASR